MGGGRRQAEQLGKSQLLKESPGPDAPVASLQLEYNSRCLTPLRPFSVTAAYGPPLCDLISRMLPLLHYAAVTVNIS